MPTVLERIVEVHRRAAATDARSLDDLVRAAAAAPPPRGFRTALRRPERVSLIAEIKRRSPTAGGLAVDLVPGRLAAAYRAGGATALSVLTDAEFFGGSPDDVAEAKAVTDLPVLRKDFTVDERDVCDARLMGADAVLLIVGVLSDGELVRLHRLAGDLGLAALVEVHDEVELERALDAGADLVGVNQRDLRTFEVDTDRAARLAPLVPSEVVTVAESGVQGADDVAALAAAGYDAVLVGQALVTAADPVATVGALVEAARRPTTPQATTPQATTPQEV